MMPNKNDLPFFLGSSSPPTYAFPLAPGQQVQDSGTGLL